MSKRNYEISPLAAYVIAESFRLVTDTVGEREIFCDIFEIMDEEAAEELEAEIHRVISRLREHGEPAEKALKEKTQ